MNKQTNQKVGALIKIAGRSYKNFCKIPATGWPPGVSQNDFHFVGEPVLGNEPDDAANTVLGKMLKEISK